MTLAILQKTLSFMIFKTRYEKDAGEMETVNKGILINILVRLKSKMHSMLSDECKESNTANGINTATELNEFKDTLLNKKVIRHEIKRIQIKKHKIGTYKINKISLSCFDDKRFALNDGIHTLAYFHKD